MATHSRFAFGLFLLTITQAAQRASADFVWVDPAWLISTSDSDDFPPYALSTVSTIGGSLDSFSAHLTTYGDNLPPGPGRGSGSAGANFSRRFEVTGAPVFIALDYNLLGYLSVDSLGGIGGSAGSGVNTRVQIAGTNFDFQYQNSIASPGQLGLRSIGVSESDTAFLSAGVYQITGSISTSSGTSSGPTRAQSDLTLSVALLLPQAVPEPGSLTLLGLGGAVFVGLTLRQCGHRS